MGSADRRWAASLVGCALFIFVTTKSPVVSAQTAPLVEIFDPCTLPAFPVELAYHLVASCGLTLESGGVQNWRPVKSDLENPDQGLLDFFQNTASRRPTVDAGAINDLDAIAFPGVDQVHLQNGENYQPLAVMAVAAVISSGTRRGLWGDSVFDRGVALGSTIRTYSTGNSGDFSFSTGTLQVNDGGVAFDNFVPHIVYATTGTNPDSNTMISSRIGGFEDLYFHGSVAEVVVFTGLP